LLFAIVTFYQTNTIAQNQNVALITGMLYENGSKEPVQTVICFIDELGNTTKSRSEINGQFQCILKLGHDYQISTQNYFLQDENIILSLRNKTNYTEIKQNYELKKLSLNSEIFSINAFSPNSNVVNSDGLKQLLKLKNFLLVNDKVRVNIKISSADTYFKPTKKTKKKTSSINPSLEKFLEQRESNIRDVLTSLKVKEFSYTLEKDYTTSTKKKTSKKKSKSKKNTQTDSNSSNVVTLKAEINRISRL